MKQLIKKIIRNFAYVWFSKTFKAIVIEDSIKLQKTYKYKLRELGFDRDIFEIIIRENNYKKNEIISLGPKK